TRCWPSADVPPPACGALALLKYTCCASAVAPDTASSAARAPMVPSLVILSGFMANISLGAPSRACAARVSFHSDASHAGVRHEPPRIGAAGAGLERVPPPRRRAHRAQHRPRGLAVPEAVQVRHLRTLDELADVHHLEPRPVGAGARL